MLRIGHLFGGVANNFELPCNLLPFYSITVDNVGCKTVYSSVSSERVNCLETWKNDETVVFFTHAKIASLFFQLTVEASWNVFGRQQLVLFGTPTVPSVHSSKTSITTQTAKPQQSFSPKSSNKTLPPTPQAHRIPSISSLQPTMPFSLHHHPLLQPPIYSSLKQSSRGVENMVHTLESNIFGKIYKDSLSLAIMRA